MATPDYLASLINTESGGNWAAQNNAVGAGGMAGHFGRVQFGRARLEDAMRAGAIPMGTTPEQFMASPDLQMAAEAWHFADLEKQLAPLVGSVVNGKPLDMAALVAMGHLGGAGGARKYVETGGAYNPSDVYGTSLSDYAATHGGGGLVASTKGGAPVEGLLGVPPEQDASGLIGMLTGKQKPWAGKLNDIGAVLLALSGSPAAQPLMDQISKRKDAAREDERINRTAAWLASVGRDDLASAMMSGALSGEDAARIALTPADPMAGIELEKAQLELDNLKAGVDQDPNVQSSAMLPDQSGVVMTLRDGSVQVRTVGGDILSGQAALDYVRKAQEAAADLQRSVYGARREGTLGADIALGGEAAAEAAKGKEVGAAAGAALAAAPVDVATADTTLTYIEDVRNHPGLDLGTGATSLGNIIPGTPGYDFQNRVDQLLSGGFLTAIDQLRGMGALSNAEGQTATRAISRMDTATSKEEFLAALADYEAMVKMGRDRAAKRVQPATETSPLASGDLGLSEDDLKYLEAP